MRRKTNSPHFRELATLIDAGFAPAAAVKKLMPQNPDKFWLATLNQLQKGHSLANSLFDNHLISRFEKEIIEVADQAGRLHQGLHHIAKTNEDRQTRINRLKIKLWYPMAIFVIGLLARALLLLFASNSPGVFAVFFETIVLFALVYGITKLFLHWFRTDSCQIISTLSFMKNKKSYQWLFESVVFQALLWQVQSGIDFKTSFYRIARMMSKKSIQQQLISIGSQCDKGMSVTQAISAASLPITEELKQVLITAESTGSWSHAIQRYLQVQKELFNDKIDALFDWAPRFYYALVVVFVVIIVL